MTDTGRAVDRYLRKIGNRLCCTKGTKEKLTEGYRQEIFEILDGSDTVSFTELEARFGTVADMAALFQEDGVGYKEFLKVRKSRRLRRAAIMILLLALLILFAVTTIKALLNMRL